MKPLHCRTQRAASVGHRLMSGEVHWLPKASPAIELERVKDRILPEMVALPALAQGRLRRQRAYSDILPATRQAAISRRLNLRELKGSNTVGFRGGGYRGARNREGAGRVARSRANRAGVARRLGGWHISMAGDCGRPAGGPRGS